MVAATTTSGGITAIPKSALSVTLPPTGIKLEPGSNPLPPEILANMQPHPPPSAAATASMYPSAAAQPLSPMSSRSSTSSQPPAAATAAGLRVRTKEETDAALDLLELSRSAVPNRSPPSTFTGQQHQHIPQHPPTPPTPEDEQRQQQQFTLIYITSPPAAAQANSTAAATTLTNLKHSSSPDCRNNPFEYPLTPPEQVRHSKE